MKFDYKMLLPGAFVNASIIVIIVLGILVRLYFAKSQIGYMGDDLSLLTCAMKFSYIDIFIKPLDIDQCCPPLFVVLLKFLYSHFGINQFILGGVCILCSCLALIFMPLLTYIICKNRFAALISLSLLAFHPEILQFTPRLKQYPIDLFLTIFLIWFGYIFFSKQVTKKRMIFFTVICITCALFSYTANIMIACLCFYYLFLFPKDNIKTKIVNFLIFIIPWLLIFIPYMIMIGINNIHNPGQISYWNYYSLSNFEQFRETILYLFGPDPDWNIYHSLKQLVINYYYGNVWFLLIPVIAGIFIIFFKNNRYLICVLVLPIITAQFLGCMNVYPLTNQRVSLWLCPIFIIFFTIPTMYIKFNKKILSCILSLIIIVYYSFIYNIDSISTIKNLLAFNYSFGYNSGHNTNNLLIEELKKLDVTDSDILCLEDEGYFESLDTNGYFTKNQKIGIEGSIEENLQNLLQIKNNDNFIYFDFHKFHHPQLSDDDANKLIKWIKQNMNIIYEYETWTGDKFIKARKK